MNDEMVIMNRACPVECQGTQRWISVEDRLPEEGQHVLVWTLRDNVYPWCDGNPMSDDGEGRVKMGDAIFRTAKAEWDKYPPEYKTGWKNYEQYIELNWRNLPYGWEGQGPCSFDDVTDWMPLPEPPTKEETQS